MDATKSETQRQQLEAELEAVGIRLNTAPPDGKPSSIENGGLEDVRLMRRGG